MKFFLALFALAAVAHASPDAEADPYLLYSGLGYRNFGYAGYAGLPYYNNLGYSAYNYAPYAYSPYRFGAYSRFFKRDAEAEADPYLLYSNLGYRNFGYAGYTGFPYYNNFGYSAYNYAPYAYGHFGAYANAGRYYANSAGVVHVAKREAEADPAVLYAGLGYSGYAAAPYTAAYAAPYTHAYGYNYAPYTYNPYFARGFGYRAYSGLYNYGRYLW